MMLSYQRIHASFSPLLKKYNRIQIKGIENLPSPENGVLLACNHSGNLWWDGLCLAASISDRQTYFIAHHWDATIPFVKSFLEAFDNDFLEPSLAEITSESSVIEALKSGKMMCQYPEESYHTLRDRYTLFKFSPQIIKYAHLANVPIIPVAMIGIEEASPTFFGIKRSGVPLHIPLHFPLVYPFKVIIEFGKPYMFSDLVEYDSGENFLDVTIYQKGADCLREHLKRMISDYRKCGVSDVRYVDKKSLF